MNETDAMALFPDLEYKHPDCWYRMKREGNIYYFMVSRNDENWEVITSTVLPEAGDFDIRMPVILPEEEFEILPPIQPYKEDEDDIT